MTLRWITNLKRIAKECKKGTYKFGDQMEEEMCLSYYMEQYDIYEEEMTFAEAEKIEESIDIYKNAVLEKYPNAKV